jgi:hypothetical protein
MALAASGAGPADAPAAPDDGEWPDESDESEFLSAAGARGGSPAPGAGRSAPPIVGERLPPLEELVARVPSDIRGILDDLFRAKFTGVRRFSAAPLSDPPQ